MTPLVSTECCVVIDKARAARGRGIADRAPIGISCRRGAGYA